MANISLFKQSFVSGEIAPEMMGRVEDKGYANGLARCRNFIVRPQGTLDNRAGLRFVAAAKIQDKAVRLIPFTFSTTQTMVLEFGERYIRFHTQAATLLAANNLPYEIETPYAAEDLFSIHYVQSADILTLVHPKYPIKELKRYGATDWRLETLSFAPKAPAPNNLRVSPSRVSRSNRSSTSVTTQNYDPVNKKYYTTTSSSTSETYEVIININYSYVVTSVKDGIESNPSSEATCQNDLYTTGNRNTLTWDAVPDIDSYCVYKKQSGMFGFCGYTDTNSFTDENISPDMAQTPPIHKAVMAAENDYPSAVSYFEQRRVFAGTFNQPQKIWMTKSGTESDMSYSMPTRDDDRIEIRVAAREANSIRHIVPLSDLLLLTSSAEWKVNTLNSDALTASTISVAPQSYIGASDVQPVIVNNTLIYVAARGGHVREMGYAENSGGYTTGDISLRAPHLFDGFDIQDMAYTKAPYPIIWFISSNGKLLGNTYVPEQQINAWHWHDTDGEFESCAVVAEGKEDYLYVVVKREINGQQKRYIERLESRALADLAHAFLVDSGLTYRGAETKVIRGLDHLEGKIVSILADGAVQPQQTVINGEIHLQHSASVIHVGLPIIADIKTLPVVGQIDNAYSKGRHKNVNKVWLDVLSSSGIFIGPDEHALVEAKQRSNEPPGTPPSLKTGEIEIMANNQWNAYGQVLVRQTAPLPLSIISLTLEVAV